MQNGLSSYQRHSGSTKDKQVSTVVRVKEQENGIELMISRKDATKSGTSVITRKDHELTLSGLTFEQILEIIKLLESWLDSESYPMMDIIINDVNGVHIDEQVGALNREARSATKEFESVTVTISEQEVQFSYWHDPDQEWKDVSIPAAQAFDRDVPQDFKNIEKLYHTFYDFFTAEYSSHVDYFESNGPFKTEQSAIYRIEQIFNRFGEIVLPLKERQGDREPLTMDLEVDVQYMLHSLLMLYFDDVRREPHTERHSSVSPRIDFLVKNETIGIEVKRASPTRSVNKLRSELAEDKEQYRLDTNIDTLLVFVYDPEKQIENKAEFEASFEQATSQMTTRVTVTR